MRERWIWLLLLADGIFYALFMADVSAAEKLLLLGIVGLGAGVAELITRRGLSKADG